MAVTALPIWRAAARLHFCPQSLSCDRNIIASEAAYFIIWQVACTCRYSPSLHPVCCSVGTVLFLALGISVAGIALHGSCRVPDDLFTDEAEVPPPRLAAAYGLTACFACCAAAMRIMQSSCMCGSQEQELKLQPRRTAATTCTKDHVDDCPAPSCWLPTSSDVCGMSCSAQSQCT